MNMGYARYIGRVGALAVALGVGISVGTAPAVAQAEDGSPASDSATSAPRDNKATSGTGPKKQDTVRASLTGNDDNSGDDDDDDNRDDDNGDDDSGEGTDTDDDSDDGADADASGDDDDDDDENADADADADAGDSDAVDTEVDDTELANPDAGSDNSPIDTAGETPSTDGAGSDPTSTPQAPAPTSPPTLIESGAPAAVGRGGEQDDAAAREQNRPVLTRQAPRTAAVSPLAAPENNVPNPETATFSAFTAATMQTAAMTSGPVSQPRPHPITNLLTIPTTVLANAIDLVVGFFKPILGPGSPLENAFLWGVLAWTRRQFNHTFANRTPDIGPATVDLTVDEDSTDNPVGALPERDSDGDRLTYRVAGSHAPENGTVTIVGNTVTYTPNAGFVGEDSFTLVGSDTRSGFHIHRFGHTHSDIATFTVTVADVDPNTAPVAGNDSYTTTEDSPLTVAAGSGLLANDSDGDGDPLQVTPGSTTLVGTLTRNIDGSFTYAPGQDFVGTETFSYEVTDGTDIAEATVTFTVTAVDDPTVAGDDAVTVEENSTATAIDVLANDSDPDGALTISGVTDPANGTVQIVNDGLTLTYTPNADFSGEDTFTYTVTDPLGGTGSATVTVTVAEPGNTAPTAADDTVTIAEDSAATGIDVLANDDDADGDALQVTQVGPAANGTVAIEDGGITVSYTPNADFTGQDTFTYTVSDGVGGTAEATVTVTVTAVDDPTLAGDDDVSVAENSTATTIDVLDNDTDIDGPLRVTSVSDPANGTAEVSADGLSLTYTPDADFTGEDTFTYAVTDPLGGTGTATVTVTVTPAAANTAPTADPTFGIPDADGVVVGTLGATDPDGDPLTFTVTDNVDTGALTLNGDGIFSYAPSPADRIAAYLSPGQDTVSFTVEISDGLGGMTSVTVGGVPILAGIPAVTDTIDGVPSPIGVAFSPDGTRAYVASGGANGSMSVIDTATNSVIDTLDIPDRVVDMAISPDGSTMYLTRTGDILDSLGTLVVFDLSTNTVTDTVEVRYNPQGLAVSPDGNRVYVANYYDHSVSIIDTATNTVIATPATGFSSAAVAVSPDNSRVYVTNNVDNTVSVIDAGTNTVIDTVAVGLAPFGVTFSPDGSRAYVANADGDSVTVINTATNVVEATVEVGDFPTAVAVSPGGTLAFVTNYGRDSVSVIDTVTNTVLTTLALDDSPVRIRPGAVMFAPDGQVAYVANATGGTVSVIGLVPQADAPAAIGDDTVAVDEDTVDNVIDVLSNDSDTDGPLRVSAVGNPTNGTAEVSADGLSLTYTPNAGFTGEDTFTYTVTDPLGGTGTGTVTVTVTVADDNFAPVANPTVGAPDPADGTVTGSLGATDPENDPLTYTVTDNVDSGSLVVNADGTFSYTPTLAARLAAFGNSTTDSFVVEISDGANLPVVVTVSGLQILGGTPAIVDTVDVGEDPVAVAVHPDGSVLYVTRAGDSDSVTVIDTATNTVITTIAVGNNPDGVAFSPDGTRAFVANTDEYDNGGLDTVTVIDTATHTAIGTITVGNVPTGVAFSPDGTRAYVTDDAFPHSVSVIDTTTDTLVATISVGFRPFGVAVSPDSSRAYVTNNLDGTVSVIDTASNTVVSTITVGDEPDGVAVTPNGTEVYVVNSDDDTVSVIDTSTDTVLTTIEVGSDTFSSDLPLGVAISPDGSLAYITNHFDGTVSVIDTASRTVVTSFDAGNDPDGVVFSPDGTRAYVVNVDAGTVSVIGFVTSVNTPASLGEDVEYIAEDSGATTIDVLANDSDIDGSLTITGVGSAVNGTAEVAAGGLSVIYTPNADFSGEDSFTYTVTDPLGGTGEASVLVFVSAVDDLPVAVADSASTSTNTVVTIDVLSNDTDVDGGPLTITGTTQGANGSVAVVDGQLSYTPDTDFSGADMFTYTLNGGSTADVSVTVIETVAPNTVVGTVGLGENPTWVSVSPDGSRVYVVNFGNLFNENNGSVTVVDMSDTANPAVLTSIPLDVQPRVIEVTPDGLQAFITYDGVVNGNGHLLVLDTDPSSPTYHSVIGDPIEVGDGPTDLVFSPDGTRAYVLNGSSLNMVVVDIDRSSATFNTVIGSPIRVANSSPDAITVTPDGTRAYITSPGFDHVVVIDIDPASPTFGSALAPPISVGDMPTDLAVTPDGTRVYVTVGFDDEVVVIDSDPTSATFNTAIGVPIPVDENPQMVAFSSDGTLGYVSSAFEHTVSIIDTDPASATFNTVIGTIDVGDIPRELAVSADGNYLYVINDRDETVSVIFIGSVM